MKGRVIFWISLQRNLASAQGLEGHGFVHFKLFGQSCQKCNCGGYENAMWYPEEVMKVRMSPNMYMRVCSQPKVQYLFNAVRTHCAADVQIAEFSEIFCHP